RARADELLPSGVFGGRGYGRYWACDRQARGTIAPSLPALFDKRNFKFQMSGIVPRRHSIHLAAQGSPLDIRRAGRYLLALFLDLVSDGAVGDDQRAACRLGGNLHLASAFEQVHALHGLGYRYPYGQGAVVAQNQRPVVAQVGAQAGALVIADGDALEIVISDLAMQDHRRWA